jgi:hypothetical protein
MDLQYYKIFNEDTSQGVVGLLRPMNKGQKSLRLDESVNFLSATDYFFVADEPSHPIYVFKIPKEVSTLADHEYKVAKDMEELGVYLPHYNRIFEIKRNVKCYIPDKYNKNEEYNPFSQYNCVRDVLILEYIPSKLTLLKYIKKTKFSGCTDSLIHQLVLALFIAQQEKKFTHYDLHFENILLRRCLKRTFFMYKFLYEGVAINRLIYTNGYFPVLFDYGFAYSQSSESTSYNNSLFFTNKGYTPFMFDEITDFKTLIVRLAYIEDCPQKFKKIADETFLKSQHLKFDLINETGWLKTKILSIAKIVLKRLKKSISKVYPDYKDSFVYEELENIIDLFGILMKLPVEQTTFKTPMLDSAVQTFVGEWKKIDTWFSSAATDDKLNIIKRIFETINELIFEEDEYDIICRKFKLRLFHIFDQFGHFVNVENLEYGQFLTSILEISNFIEYITYSETQRYKKLFNFADFMDSWSLLTSLEKAVYTDKPYQFEEGDSIVVFDCIDKSVSSFDLKDSDVIETLNLSVNINSQIELLNNLELTNMHDE